MSKYSCSLIVLLFTLPGCVGLDPCLSPLLSAPVLHKHLKGFSTKTFAASYSTSLQQRTFKQINSQGSTQRGVCECLRFSKINQGFLWECWSLCVSESSIPSEKCFLYSDSWGLADHGVRIIAILGNLSYDKGKVMQMSKCKQIENIGFLTS